MVEVDRMYVFKSESFSLITKNVVRFLNLNLRKNFRNSIDYSCIFQLKETLMPETVVKKNHDAKKYLKAFENIRWSAKKD